jgi:transposase
MSLTYVFSAPRSERRAMGTDSLIPEPQRRKDGRGRPWRGRREVLDGILFILRTVAAWADLPERYPPY